MTNKPKAKTKTVTINRMELPLLAAQRDAALESSDYYKRNMASLKVQMVNRCISGEMAARIQPSIAMAALRYAGFSLRDSERMVRA